MTHLPCVAIIVAVCAVVLCMALSLARKVNFGAGGDVESRNVRSAITTPVGSGPKSWPAMWLRGKGYSQRSDWPTRTIPNEQAKRRAMWAKIVRKM